MQVSFSFLQETFIICGNEMKSWYDQRENGVEEFPFLLPEILDLKSRFMRFHSGEPLIPSGRIQPGKKRQKVLSPPDMEFYID